MPNDNHPLDRDPVPKRLHAPTHEGPTPPKITTLLLAGRAGRSALSQFVGRGLLAVFMGGGLGCTSDEIETGAPDWAMCVGACAKISCLGPTTGEEIAGCVDRCLDTWEDAVTQGEDCTENYADIIACFDALDCDGHIEWAKGDETMCSVERVAVDDHCEDITWLNQ